MAVSKKVRFDVFKRDGFTCQYCGRTPPAVVLEADHIDPKANGGLDVIHNLITACADCNRGKSSALLTTIPESLTVRAQGLAEREAQLKAYSKLQKTIKGREDKDIDAVQKAFQALYPSQSFTTQFRESVRHFLQHLPVEVLCDAMNMAISRMADAERAASYFCGICWRKIRAD